MARGEAAFAHKCLHLGREFQEAQRVGNDDATLADLRGGLLLRQVELPDQLRVASGLLNGVEVLPLEVLDERQFQYRPIIRRADNDRHFRQPDHLGGAPAAFAGDQFVMITLKADNERLNDALFLDRVRQLPKGFGGKILSRLQRRGADRATGTRWTVSEEATNSGAAGTAMAGAADWPDAPIPPSKAFNPRPIIGFAMTQTLRANGGTGKGKVCSLRAWTRLMLKS